MTYKILTENSEDKLNVYDIGGATVKDNETYRVKDNTTLNNLVVSSTELKSMQSTRGHKHQGQEEVYHFISGYGKMELDDRQFHVKGGDIVLIPDGSFHRVHNTSEHGALYFICVLTVIKENGFTNYSNDVEMG